MTYGAPSQLRFGETQNCNKTFFCTVYLNMRGMLPTAWQVKCWAIIAIGCLSVAVAVHAAESQVPVPVTFSSDGLRLVGNLYLPDTAGPHPALVFTHGSGGSGRDNQRHVTEAIHFARQGIVSFVFDKRGYGESEGDWQMATFEDLAIDALAAISLLKTRLEVDPARIGLRGASQSSWILPIAAARSDDVAHIILISPAGVTPYEQIVFDVRTDLEDAGHSPVEVERGLELLRSGLNYGRTGRGWSQHAERLEAAAEEPWFDIASGPPVPDHWMWRWLRPIADFDSVPVLERISTPALVLLGEQDRVCPWQVAGYRIGNALSKRPQGRHLIRYFPSGDHDLKMTTESGASVLVEGYLDTIVEWVHSH